MTESEQPDIDTTFLVLCGGAGSRMAGRDKPLLEFRGIAMLDHVLASAPQHMPRLISANRNLDQYQQRAGIVTDQAHSISGASGPLMGIYAGLCMATTTWLLVAPGDTPCLADNWWRVMQRASGGTRNVVAHDGQRQQHLHLLLHRTKVIDSLRDYLSAGRHQVYAWLESVDLVQARFDSPDDFRNINTEDDLR